MGIFKGLLGLAEMKLKGQDINPDHLLIDKIVFIYKFLSRNNFTFFNSEDDFILFVMSYILRRDIEKQSVNTDDLRGVINSIYQDVAENTVGCTDRRIGQYKLYKVVYQTLAIHYQISYMKYTNNFTERAIKKLEDVNEYINIKTVLEYDERPLINTPFKRDFVENIVKELTS